MGVVKAKSRFSPEYDWLNQIWFNQSFGPRVLPAVI